MSTTNHAGMEHERPRVAKGLGRRPSAVVGKRARSKAGKQVLPRLADRPPASSSSVPLAALSYRARLADAESDAAEMELQGVPEAYVETMALIAIIKAERKQATVRVAPITIARASAELAKKHAMSGVYERALETSEARRRQADVLEWAGYCFLHKSKITLQEWRTLQRNKVVPIFASIPIQSEEF